MEKFDKGDPSGRNSTPTSVSTRTPEKDGTLKQAANKDFQEEKMNPLNIPEIVTVVVGHLSDVGDLRSVRTQSTVWRDETLQKWRDSAVLLITVETFPILVKAFEEADLAHFCEGGNDPFKLKKVPFKKYRFAGNIGDQLWTYPLREADLKRRLLWDKVITPHANYLDVGPCSLRKFTGGGEDVHYQPALRWIIKRCPNVTDLAIAPLKSMESVDTLSDSEEESDPNLRWDYWFRPGGPFWKLKRFTAVHMTSLTLSTPLHAWRSMNGSEILKGFFEHDRFQHDKYFAEFLMKGLTNLKHLHLPTGGGATDLFPKLQYNRNIRLETLTAFASKPKHCLKLNLLHDYTWSVRPPLRELRMTLFVSRGHGIYTSFLSHVRATLQKLEFEIKVGTRKECTLPSSSQGTPEASFSFLGCSLEKLTHLKITMDYNTAPWIVFKFNLNCLTEMHALEEFYFGMKDPINKAWVTKKFQFFEVCSRPSVKLDNLKSFYYHGNFKNETMYTLGRMTAQVETIGVVLDEENCIVVQKSWPRLKNLKLLEGSDVPEELLSSLKSKRSLQSLECL